MSKNQVVDLIQQTSHLNQELEKTTKGEISEIERTAEKYSNKSSEYLCAVLGGGIGFSGGFGLSLAGVSLVFSGPIGMILGAALAVLMWRGKGQNKIERANKKVEVIKSKIISELKNLPSDAPEYIKKQLWDIYKNSGIEYEKIVIEGLSDGTSKFDTIHEKKLIE